MKRDPVLWEILKKHEEGVLHDWLDAQLADKRIPRELFKEGELKAQSQQFLGLLTEAIGSGATQDFNLPVWTKVKEALGKVSRNRGLSGFTPTETATFVLSLKNPLFKRVRELLAKDPEALFQELWLTTELLDGLALYTTEIYQKSREEVIVQQQQDLLELSTPVVKMWDGILALPMIGILDSGRTQVVMENLLQRIVETGADVAIIDITGVPTVDTLVAQHLMKTVTAARLMGAECIISGIRPQIAQTIVHLGVDLGDIITKASLADAFRTAIAQRGLKVVAQKVT